MFFRPCAPVSLLDHPEGALNHDAPAHNSGAEASNGLAGVMVKAVLAIVDGLNTHGTRAEKESLPDVGWWALHGHLGMNQ